MTEVRLSDNQRRVVEFDNGPIAVIAGPGSGKTRVLTERIRRLLTQVPGHFRVLALTFTNKAAKEMNDRLADLVETRKRAFIGTMHSFCLDVLADRGKHVGLATMPQIFEHYQDRKQILIEAVEQDPELQQQLDGLSPKDRAGRIDSWLKGIATIKAHPITKSVESDDFILQRAYEGYNAGLKACGGCDFDDLLLYTYQLFSQFPQVADFYRRVFGYICMDEAQDLNEAQYAVLQALSGESFNNIMMVGDPNQSIYGFNTSSPDYLEKKFPQDFGATVIRLDENYRSARAVVREAQSLDPSYKVTGQLAIEGAVKIVAGDDEADEARRVATEVQHLMATGHPDVEGPIVPTRIAILGRTRYVLLGIERELQERQIPFFKRLSIAYENECKITDEFQLALRVLANPRDSLHLRSLASHWRVQELPGISADSGAAAQMLVQMAAQSGLMSAQVIAAALFDVQKHSAKRLDLLPAFAALTAFADTMGDDDRQALREDMAVLTQEWDHYLRTEGRAKTLTGLMSSLALGSSGQASKEGVALLTVHSAKGLEFDVVFVMGMAEGVFPDYRAKSPKSMQEERRNAFVAVTRSKRLLYLTYPKKRLMSWGDVRHSTPSQFISNSAPR